MQHMWTPYIPEADRWCIVYLHRHTRLGMQDVYKQGSFQGRICTLQLRGPGGIRSRTSQSEVHEPSAAEPFGVSVKIQNGGGTQTSSTSLPYTSEPDCGSVLCLGWQGPLSAMNVTLWLWGPKYGYDCIAQACVNTFWNIRGFNVIFILSAYS